MLELKQDSHHLILIYSPDSWDIEAVIRQINTSEGLTLQKTFYLSKGNLFLSEKECLEREEVQFIIGQLEGDYYKINKTILDINYDLYFFKGISPIKPSHFISYKNVSIFGKIGQLKINRPFYIGGEEQNSLPVEIFNQLIKQFPNQYELRRYVEARICGAIKDYFDISDEAELKYERYLNKKRQNLKKHASRKLPISEAEKEKYEYLYKTLEEMLREQDSYSEEMWQEKLLGILKFIFPKYISVLNKVEINSKKQLDYLLVDTNGYVDVIEIKKPNNNSLLYQKQYRNNFTPIKELSGAVMQTEKYIFHLSRWGERGEEALTEKYRDKLPKDLKIKIINPKGIVIIGRENNLEPEQKQDFEFIKRQYKNIVEIITYDNLIERIKRVINSFTINGDI